MTPAPEIDHEEAREFSEFQVRHGIKDHPATKMAAAYLALAPRLAAAEKALLDERTEWRAAIAGRDALLAAYRVGRGPNFKKVDRGNEAEDRLTQMGALSASPPQAPENRAAPGRGREEADDAR